MKKEIFILVFLVFFFSLVNTAMADVSVTVLKGTATGEKKAALFVSVVDDAGKPIKGLTKENFKLLAGGEEIANFNLEPVSTTQEPLSLVLGIDISGSMRGKPFDETKNAVHGFLFQLDREDFISLQSFGTEVKFLTDFIKEKDKGWKQVEPLRPVDMWTHLYDATYEAIRKAKEAPTNRVAIILLTDGREDVEEGSRGKTREEAVDIVAGASIPVFTIGFGHKIDHKYLEEISRQSGGYFLFTPEPEEIGGLYSKVLEQLKNQYIISFDFQKEPGDYKAILDLTYGDKRARASKEFLFNPIGPRTWWRQIPKGYRILGGVLLSVIALALVILAFKKSEKIEVPQKECYLEFPEGKTVVEFVESRSDSMTEGTRLSTHSQDVFLKVDGLKKPVPLVNKGIEILDKLIIARRSEEGKPFKQKDVAYLWTRNNHVSGPKKGIPGHARIFFLSEQERFAIEDLGSTNGTLVNERNIKGKGAVPLQDGYIIYVGGKQGLRIDYRESEIGKENYEGTIIAEQ